MKFVRLIIWLVAIIVALIALVLWFGKKKPVTSSTETNGKVKGS